MADISAVKARIDINKKNNFDLRPPLSKPLAIGAISKGQLAVELQKGVDSVKVGKVYSAEKVDLLPAKEFRI